MKPKILIIEDHLEIRENLGELLELSNYEVSLAANGLEGVKLAQTVSPDLILCDIMMPELDGYGVLHILNRDPKTNCIPFIFLTAKAEKEDLRKGMALGADDYLTKPINEADLLQTIENKLRRFSSLRSTKTQGFESFIKEVNFHNVFDFDLSKFENKNFSKKEHLYKEGEKPKFVFYIRNGEVKVSRFSDEGKELIIEIFKPGDFFGYTAILANVPYPDESVCLTDVELTLIPEKEFASLFFSQREVGAYFIKILANNKLAQEEKIIQLAYDSVRRRVATALLNISNESTEKFKWQRDDLAALAGTAKETLIRTLSDFKHEKLIDISDNQINIINVQKLKQMVN